MFVFVFHPCAVPGSGHSRLRKQAAAPSGLVIVAFFLFASIKICDSLSACHVLIRGSGTDQ